MTTEYSTGYEPWPEAFSVAQQLTHSKMAGEEIFALEQDGRNWSAYSKMLLHEADVEGLQGLFDGTEAQPLDEGGTDSLWDQWNAQAMYVFIRHDHSRLTIPLNFPLRHSTGSSTLPTQPIQEDYDYYDHCTRGAAQRHHAGGCTLQKRSQKQVEKTTGRLTEERDTSRARMHNNGPGESRDKGRSGQEGRTVARESR